MSSLAQTADELVAVLETREASPSHFLMRVESFSLLGENGIHKYESGEFSAGGYKWRLILYPNEDKSGEDKNYISVYLAIFDTTSLPASWEVNAIFSFFLFNQISCNYLYSLGQNLGPKVQLNLTDSNTEGPKMYERNQSGRTRRFLPMKPVWGISKFMSKKVLTDPSNGYLIDNNCMFGVEVFIVEKPILFECLSVKNVIIPFKRDWKISNFSKLVDCWTSEKFVDEGVNWEVLLYPNGHGNGVGRCLTVFLQLIDSKRVNARFSICIRDQIKNKHEKRTDSYWFSQPSRAWGWDIMELATLKDPRNGFIINDSCLIEIELYVRAVV